MQSFKEMQSVKEMQSIKEMQKSTIQDIVKSAPIEIGVKTVPEELQDVNQMQNPTVANCDICDKTSLYYTIGVLVILLIILIGYTIYQSGKNSN